MNSSQNLITSFDHFDDFNSWYQQIFLDKINLIPYNSTVYTIVKNGLYPIARDYITNGTYLHDQNLQSRATPFLLKEVTSFILRHNQQVDIDSNDQMTHCEMTQEQRDHYATWYYFPFTRSTLYSIYFNNFMPSFAEKIFNLLKQQNVLIQYGPGLGSSFAFKKVDLSSLSIDLFSVNPEFDYKSYKNYFEQFFSSFEDREKDFNYLKSENESLKKKIAFLEENISELQAYYTNRSLSTWA